MGYILHLKEEKILSPQSLGISTAALKHFYDMNDVILNWKKIKLFVYHLWSFMHFISRWNYLK